jgi:putative ABC transport system permease protein
MLLLRSQRRFLQRSPWSAGTALLGVTIGVASIVAVHLISAAVDRSLADAQPPHLLGITHLLDGPEVDAERYFRWRAAWRSTVGSEIRALLPMVEGRLTVNGRRVQLVGADWLAAPPPEGRGSHAFSVPAEVIVGESVLVGAGLGHASGELLRLGGREYRVAGVLPGMAGDMLVTDIAVAHRLLDLPSEALTRVGIAVQDSWAPWRQVVERIMPGFSAGLPQPGALHLASLLPGIGIDAQQLVHPVTADRPNAAFARSVLFNLGALGTLALVVAWFLMHQVAVIWLLRQRPVLQRLHVVGATERSLLLTFLLGMGSLGVLATLLGIPVGVLLARALMHVTMQAVPGAEPLPVAVDVWLLLKAAVSGLGVCLLGGLAAFFRVWRSGSNSLARRAGWLLLPAVMLPVGLFVDATGVLGGFAAIVAMSLLAMAMVGPLLGGMRRLSHQVSWSWLARLALRDVAWYPRVLGVALAALSLAVATGIGIGLMVESFRLDFSRMLESRLAGDLYVFELNDRLAEVTRWLQAQPDVTRVQPAGSDQLRVDGRRVTLGYTTFDAAESARYGHTRALTLGEVLLSEPLARQLGVRRGGRLSVADVDLRVAGVFPGYGEPSGRMQVDDATLPALNVPLRHDRLTVTVVPSGAAGAALEERLTAAFPMVRLESRQAVRQEALAIFDRTFAITRALTLLALLVAAVGMYNALTALRLQQAPTLALLHAQGLLAGEARRIGLWRCLAAGALAVGLALPLGIAMAWTLCAVINPRSFGWTVSLALPPSGWILPVLLGLMAAVLAGLLPAPTEREASLAAA